MQEKKHGAGVSLFVDPSTVLNAIVCFVLYSAMWIGLLIFNLDTGMLLKEPLPFLAVFLGSNLIYWIIFFAFFRKGCVRVILHMSGMESRLLGRRLKKISLNEVRYVYLVTAFNPGPLNSYSYMILADKALKNGVFSILTYKTRDCIPVRLTAQNFDMLMQCMNDLGIEGVQDHDYDSLQKHINEHGLVFERTDNGFICGKTKSRCSVEKIIDKTT